MLPPEYEPGSSQPGVYPSVAVQNVAVPKGGAAEPVDALPAGFWFLFSFDVFFT